MRNSISSVVLACCTALFAMLLLVAAAMSGAPRHSNALACSATADDGATVHESADASGLRAALTHAVSISATTVKVAGTCAGVISQTGSAQLALITRAVTLEGGYTPTHWLANYPMTQPTTLDAQGAGRVLRSSANITVNDMLLMNGLITGNGGGLLAEANARLLGVIFQNNQASGDGGGAYIGGRARVLDTRAVSNSAGASGGGIATGDVSRVTFAKLSPTRLH